MATVPETDDVGIFVMVFVEGDRDVAIGHLHYLLVCDDHFTDATTHEGFCEDSREGAIVVEGAGDLGCYWQDVSP